MATTKGLSNLARKNTVARKPIAEALFNCKTKKEVEKLFEEYKVNSREKKIKALNECMGSPMTFYSHGNKMDPGKKYALELQIFVLGKWRVIDLYKKMEH